MKSEQDPKQKPAPIEPDKNVPIKPDQDPDPTKRREHNDPTKKEDPSTTDPTKIKEPRPNTGNY